MRRDADFERAMRQAAALFGQGKLAEAQALAEEIQRVDGRHFYALHLLSTIAMRRSDWEEGLRLASAALEVDPRHVEVLCNRGSALRMLHRYSEALADYDRALAIAPGSHVALNNRGVALAALGRHGEALASFGAALRITPDNPRARYGRGISRLMEGDFAAGWDDYEWRWAGSENATAMRPLGVPLFTDDDWGRCRLALWTEQGLGDQLLFSTLVPELEARGQAFVLEADARLVPAFRRAHPAWTVVSPRESETAFNVCDRHLPIGSLPRLLRRTRDSFERQPKALLAADPDRTARFRSRFESAGALVVGISWRTFQPKTRTYYEGRKNAPLDAFRDLSRARDLRLIDLQYGDTATEFAAFAANGGRLIRLEDLDKFNDLEGLLAAIEACDVIVSTSNVTAHLAGCLGKRTMVVYLRANPAFHYWVADARGRCPWYPSVEIVSDPAMDSWDEALRRVTDRLRR